MRAVEIERTTKGGTSPPISLPELTQCPGARAIECVVHREGAQNYVAFDSTRIHLSVEANYLTTNEQLEI